MRKYTIAGLAALLLATPIWADTPQVKFATLASSFDLDGEGVDVDQIVTAVDAEDDKTDYTLAADPDACRLIDVTVVDADSSLTAGAVTVTGTDCWGHPLAATYTFDAGGSVVLTGVVVDSGDYTAMASGAYFSTVTDVTTDELTGEAAGDTIAVGYSTGPSDGWAMYGREGRSTGGTRRYVDPFGKYDVNCLVTSGATSVDIIGVTVASTACFQNVSAGDLLVFNLAGDLIVRKVVTRTDADNVVVDEALSIVAAGVNFAYRKRFFSTDPIDGWINVQGYRAVSFAIEVDANTDTGGVITSIECASAMSGDLPTNEIVVEVDTDTVASAATGFAVTSIILSELPHYTHCRAGIKFVTNDDDDTGIEDIDITVALTR